MLAMATVAHDADLIPGLTARDEGTVQDFVDRYWTRAYRVAYQLTGDAAGAEDVAQDAMLGALNGVGRLQEGDPFRAWFFRILENTAKKHHRSRYRREAREERGVRAERTTDPVADAERAEERTLVREHLTRLSPKLRHTLALRYLEGMSLDDTARALGVPRKTVSSRVRLGLKSLRGSLEPHMACSSAILPALLVDAMSIDAPPAPAGAALTGTTAPQLIPSRGELLAGAPSRGLIAAGTLLALGLLAALIAWGPSLGDGDPPPRVASPPPTQPEDRSGEAAPVASATSRDPEPGAATDAVAEDAQDTEAPLVERREPEPALAAAPGTIRVRGRVTLGGHPLPGALLTLWNVDDPVESGPDGALAVDYVHGPRDFFGQHGVRLKHEGKSGYHYGILHPRMRVLDGEGKPLPPEEDGEYWDLPRGLSALTLEVEVPGAPLSGQVVDAAGGAPIPHATISAGALAVTATADGGGRFTIPLPYDPGSDHPLKRTGGFLRVEAPGYGAAFALVHEAEQFEGLTIRLARGRDVSGRVTDTRGRSVPNAVVRASEWVPEGGSMRGSSWAPMVTRRAETAADGSFTLRDLGPDTRVELTVLGRDSAFDARYHRLNAPQAVPGAEPLKLVLRCKADDQRAEGRVVDPAGTPLEHAVLTPLGSDPQARLTLARRFVNVFEGATFSLKDSLRSPQGEATDATGRFAFSGPEAASATLVTAPGYADRLLAPGQARGPIRLEPECPTGGRLRDRAGADLGGWTVLAYDAGSLAEVRAQPRTFTDPLGLVRRKPTPEEARTFLTQERAVRSATTTRADGTFALPGLTRARYDLVFQAVGVAALNAPPPFVVQDVAAGSLGPIVAPASRRVSVALQPLAEESGQPLQVSLVVQQGQVSVGVYPGVPHERDAARFAAGSRIAELPFVGRSTLVVLAPGRAPLRLELQGAEGLTDLGAVRLPVSAGSLELQVSDATQRPLHAVGVYVRHRESGVAVHARVPSEGRLRLDRFTGGTHEVQVYVRERLGGPLRVLPPQEVELGGGQTATVEARLPVNLDTLPRGD